MNMKIVAVGPEDISDALVNIVEEIELPVADRFTLGVRILHTAAEYAAKRNPGLSARVDAKTKGMPPGQAMVVACIEYLTFVEECRVKGTCACGNPECGAAAEPSSESSTSIH